MRCIHRKLHSKRGVSAIIALVFLLFCATVGAIVLTAASANAGKSTRVQKEQQAYFAVRSAAQLVRDEIEGTVFPAKYKKVLTATETSSQDFKNLFPEYPDPVYDYPDRVDTELEMIGGWMKDDAERIFQFKIEQMNGPAESYTPTIQKFQVTADHMPDISATYQMNEDYTVQFTFRVEGAAAQNVTLVIPVDLIPVDLKDGTSYSTEKWTTLLWVDIIDPITGEDAGKKELPIIQQATVQHIESTVTWGRGVLTKGIESEVPAS